MDQYNLHCESATSATISITQIWEKIPISTHQEHNLPTISSESFTKLFIVTYGSSSPNIKKENKNKTCPMLT